MQAVALGALIDKRAAGNHLSEQEERRLSERPIEATCAYLAAYRGHVGQVPPPHAGIRMFSLQRSARTTQVLQTYNILYISTPRSFTAKGGSPGVKGGVSQLQVYFKKEGHGLRAATVALLPATVLHDSGYNTAGPQPRVLPCCRIW